MVRESFKFIVFVASCFNFALCVYMKIKLNHLRLVLRIGLRLVVRVRDFLAPPPGADLALGDIAALGDITFCDLEASSAAHLWQINSSCSPSPRVV